MSLPILNQTTGKPKKVIAVASCKGGVGKSTITVNLALALNLLGVKVGVMDIDIYGPSLPVILPPEKPPRYDNDRLIPGEAKGIKVISTGFFEKGQETNLVRAPIANGIIKQFIENVDWGDLDVLLIDFPPGTGDIQLSLLQQLKVDQALVITTPQLVAAVDAKKSIEMFFHFEVPIFGIIENMSYYIDPLTKERHYIFGSSGGDRLAKMYNLPIAKRIPIDPFLNKLLDSGASIFEEIKPSCVEGIFIELAVEISRLICNDTYLENNLHKFKITEEGDLLLKKGKDQKIIKASKLQENCKCVLCVNKSFRKSEESIKIKKIKEFENFGLQFNFNKGCSRGIYRWRDLLNI